MDILKMIFENVLSVTITSSIIALLILCGRYLLKSKISIKFSQILLSIVLLRFCMLIVPESHISILNLLPQYKVDNTITESLSTIHHNTEEKQTPTNSTPIILQNDYEENVDAYSQEYVDDIVIQPDNKIGYKDVFSIIWLVGFILILAGTVNIQLKLNNKLKSCKKMNDKGLLGIVDRCKRKIGVKNEVMIYMGNYFRSPFIIGFIKPKIYIPQQLMELGPEHFEHVIIHELTHYKRKDLIYNVFIIIASAIHWFNPLIWKLTKMIKSNMELACDEYVLENLGEEKAVSYGKSILSVTRLIITSHRQIGLACYFSNSSKQLERRIIMINKFRKNTYKFTAVTLSAALMVGGIVLTNPVKARAENNLPSSSMNVLKENPDKDIIGTLLKDTRCKRYNNLDRFVDDVDFNFMVPDYIPDNNYHVSSLKWYTQDQKVRLSYSNMNNGQGFHYDLRISPIDPEKNLGGKFEDDEKIDRCSKNMEDVQGEILTTKNYNKLKKYFVYKKDGLYYDIEYQRMDENNNVVGELSESEVAKIIKSLKNPEEVNKDTYDLLNEFIRLYDMEDLKATREMIGFNFKVPMDNLFGKCSEISSSDRKYISFLFIGSVRLYQSTEIPYYYDQFTKYGKLEMADSEKAWFDKMEGTWEYINDRKVLKIVDTYDLLPEQKLNNEEPDKDVDYTWFDDGIYYSVSSGDCDNIENIDEIIKHIMDSKSYDEIMK